MTKASISDVKDALTLQQENYQKLHDALGREHRLTLAKREDLLNKAAPQFAGFLMPFFQAGNEAELRKLEGAMASSGPRAPRPFSLMQQRRDETQQAAREIEKFTKEHGPPEALAQKLVAQRQQLESDECSQRELSQQANDNNDVLRLFDSVNTKLSQQGKDELTLETLGGYTPESGWMKHAWRKLFDPVYEVAAPMIERYAKAGINLPQALRTRETLRTQRCEYQAARQEALARATRTDQLITQHRWLTQGLHTEPQIVQESYPLTLKGLREPEALRAVASAFPLPADLLATLQKVEVLDKLASGIARSRDEARKTLDQLEDPVSKLNEAMQNGNASKRIEFDLPDRTQQMNKHQTVLGQRARAAQDVRQRVDSAPPRSSDNSWLYWYLLTNEGGPSHSAAPAFRSGGGGDFGGGGADGRWDTDDEPARNSYFRAEMLGVTPKNAASFGIDPVRLRIEPEVLRDLDVKFDTISPTGVDFNALSNGIEFDPRKLDLGSTVSDLSRSISSISDSVSSNWGSSSDSSSFSSDSSSFSSDSGSSCSFD